MQRQGELAPLRGQASLDVNGVRWLYCGTPTPNTTRAQLVTSHSFASNTMILEGSNYNRLLPAKGFHPRCLASVIKSSIVYSRRQPLQTLHKNSPQALCQAADEKGSPAPKVRCRGVQAAVGRPVPRCLAAFPIAIFRFSMSMRNASHITEVSRKVSRTHPETVTVTVMRRCTQYLIRAFVR